MLSPSHPSRHGPTPAGRPASTNPEDSHPASSNPRLTVIEVRLRNTPEIRHRRLAGADPVNVPAPCLLEQHAPSVMIEVAHTANRPIDTEHTKNGACGHPLRSDHQSATHKGRKSRGRPRPVDGIRLADTCAYCAGNTLGAARDDRRCAPVAAAGRIRGGGRPVPDGDLRRHVVRRGPGCGCAAARGEGAARCCGMPSAPTASLLLGAAAAPPFSIGGGTALLARALRRVA